jgi:regulatory protein
VSGAAANAGRQPPRPPTPERLQARALHYLERFATSRAHLRRVLLRRALREAAQLGLDPGTVRRDVDDLVARLAGAGLIDDRLFAAARARRLAAAGRSPARIRQALATKGLDERAVDAAVASLAEGRADPELAAAVAYARRRRLGPWRPVAERAALRARDLAALGRAGFGYRVAREVLEAADPDELEARAAAMPG